MEGIRTGLLEFFRQSPHDALQHTDVDEQRNELLIRMDIDDRHASCCEISVSFLPENVIRIVLDELRLFRSTGCRSGNDYLGAINYMLDHYFTPDNPELTGKRVYFKVQSDISSMNALPGVVITPAMKAVTNVVSQGGTLEYMDGSVRDFHSLRLSNLKTYKPSGNLDLADFWKHVVQKDYPTLYDGSMRVRGLAALVLEDVRSVDFTDGVEPEQTCWIVHTLLKNHWYVDVLPDLMWNLDKSRLEQPHGRPEPPKVISFQFIDLGLITLLSREDFKTWYMKHLNLSLCDRYGNGLSNASELERAVEHLQSVPFIEIVPPAFQKYFSTTHTPRTTTKAVVLECIRNLRARKRLTFFETLQVYFINWQQNNHFRVLIPYFHDVCRVLVG